MRTPRLTRAIERMCRGCGCTDSRACPGGCSWFVLDIEQPTGICSRCAAEAGASAFFFSFRDAEEQEAFA